MIAESKVILITGASRGIGAAIAKAMAGTGKTILINFKSAAKQAKEVEKAVRAQGADAALLKADVSSAKAVDAMFKTIEKRWGRLDALVCNAAITPRYERLIKTTPAEFEAHWKVQALGSYLCCRRAVPLMRDAGGDVVFILSGVARAEPPAFMSPYVSAKYATLGLAKALAAETKDKGIRVHTLFPGFTDTDMIKALPRQIIETAREAGQVANPEDVAQRVKETLENGRPLTLAK